MSDEFTSEDYSSDMATMGDRIAGARAACGMSTREVAEHLGVKKSTIKKWENDRSEPRSNRLYMLAGILECNVMWLLNGEGDAPSDTKSGQENNAHIRGQIAELRKSARQLMRQIDQLEKSL